MEGRADGSVVMRNRPTADELGQEFAALKQAHDLARTAATFALEQHQVAFADPKLMTRLMGTAEPFKNEVADNLLQAFVVAKFKGDEFEQAMTKVRKQAWKWYRVVL